MAGAPDSTGLMRCLALVGKVKQRIRGSSVCHSKYLVQGAASNGMLTVTNAPLKGSQLSPAAMMEAGGGLLVCLGLRGVQGGRCAAGRGRFAIVYPECRCDTRFCCITQVS